MDLRFHALDVYFILKEINSSKATGPDGIDGIVLKNCAASLAKPLSLMFNTSFATRQHGFLIGKSCTTQMVPFIDDLSLALNNKIRSDIIYFDFAKAFDSVSHDLILYKLKHLFGIDGLMLRFIKSYLQGRQQQVVVAGAVSNKFSVKSGVP